MYEEKRFIRKKINWKSVFLKLLLVILIAFLIWFLIYKLKSNKTTSNNNNGNSMNENLKYFKDQSIKYFDDNSLPVYINSQKKVTLEDMIKAGAVKDIIDKDGNKCSTTSSYAQVTKINASNYNLKVYIKCKNEADSILTTVSRETFVTNTLNGEKKKTTNKKNTNTDNKKTTTDTTKTNTDNTKTTTTTDTTKTTTTDTNKTTNTNNNKSKSTSSSSSKTSTSSTSTNKSTTTSTSQSTTVATTTSTSTTTNTTTNTSTNNNSGSTTNANVPDPSKLLYTEYRLIKYGEWQREVPTSGNYFTQTISVVYNKYCYGTDYNNCHVIAKADKYKKDIEYLLMQGYEEIYDHTDYFKFYQPYELIWSKTKDVEGYTYTGDHREVYKMN